MGKIHTMINFKPNIIFFVSKNFINVITGFEHNNFLISQKCRRY